MAGNLNSGRSYLITAVWWLQSDKEILCCKAKYKLPLNFKYRYLFLQKKVDISQNAPIMPNWTEVATSGSFPAWDSFTQRNKKIIKPWPCCSLRISTFYMMHIFTVTRNFLVNLRIFYQTKKKLIDSVCIPTIFPPFFCQIHLHT